MGALRLPEILQRRVNDALSELLNAPASVDFKSPCMEEALVPPTSVSWRIFKNPVALFVGGTAAVILELAESSVRAGIWEHSSFRTEPIARLKRTGLAAMVTVYGARRSAESMIQRVRCAHGAVQGITEHGLRYSANDPELLTWVHATAAFGFAAAYDRYVARLSGADLDRLYREGEGSARLYGADAPPRSRLETQMLFERMQPRLSASPVVFEFLKIMSFAPALPQGLAWMQKILVRAAVELLPLWVRTRLNLMRDWGLSAPERWLVERAGAAADRILVPASPAAQSCLRLGLPLDYLYAHTPTAGPHPVLEYTA